jgi:hypothetical protein
MVRAVDTIDCASASGRSPQHRCFIDSLGLPNKSSRPTRDQTN